MQDKTIKEILESEVYEEDFLLAFQALLEKFVNEFDDMAQMNAIQKAKELLDIFNE